MKILFGVQGTGNGHITRARAMQVALAAAGIEVDWVFSGRERSRFFDMQAFGDFKVFKGLSFATKAGKVDMIKTFAEASLHQMYQDIRTLDLTRYQLVISDFEPVVAWAARKQELLYMRMVIDGILDESAMLEGIVTLVHDTQFAAEFNAYEARLRATL